MKQISSILHVVPVLMLLAGTPVLAAETGSTTMDIVREALRADKKALIAANMELSEKDSKEFWPVYDRYQADLLKAHGQLFEVIAEYSSTVHTITDEQAKDLIERYLKAEEARAKVRRSYVGELGKVLDGKALARFYQLENKIDAVVRYEMAAEIPLVGK